MEPLTDDEINEHNLRHLANCDGRVTLSAMVQSHHVEAAAWAVAEIESLRQQLADVTAELDYVTEERDRYSDELLEQPPTLEWLRETFGEPSKRHGTVTEWGSYESPFWIMYQIGGHVSVCVRGQNVMVPKETRAAVLEAVAETKGASDGE